MLLQQQRRGVESKLVQLSQSSPGNIGGSYFGQNMRGGNILATSVLLQKKFTRPTTGGKGNFFLQVFTSFYKYHMASII